MYIQCKKCKQISHLSISRDLTLDEWLEKFDKDGYYRRGELPKLECYKCWKEINKKSEVDG